MITGFRYGLRHLCVFVGMFVLSFAFLRAEDAFLVRITHIDSGNVAYHFATGVDAISETIDGVTYAWAAFPVTTLWRPGTYVDYAIFLSNGAGYVAPGADDGVAFRPILNREIKFTEEVQYWPNYNDVSLDHDNEEVQDGSNYGDAFSIRAKK